MQNFVALLAVAVFGSSYPLAIYVFLTMRFANIERAIPGLSRYDLAWRFLLGKPLLDLDGVEPIPPPAGENAE